MLLDSNIIIYSSKREQVTLRRFIDEATYSVSAISCVEVLGYHRLIEKEREHLEEFFDAATVLSISTSVISQAVQLRQMKRMSLGDAIVAGTALVHHLELITRNVGDFSWIPSLSVSNPFELLG